MVHLTHTSFLAGQLLCGEERKDSGEYVHAIHAPLSNSEFRARCCEKCLNEWILSFDEDEEKPKWAK